MQRRTYSALISATALFVGFGMLSSQASSEPASPDAGALKLHFRSRESTGPERKRRRGADRGLAG